jgi:hypothetical protein
VAEPFLGGRAISLWQSHCFSQQLLIPAGTLQIPFDLVLPPDFQLAVLAAAQLVW